MVKKGDIVVDTYGYAFAVEGEVICSKDQNKILVQYPACKAVRDHRDLTVIRRGGVKL